MLLIGHHYCTQSKSQSLYKGWGLSHLSFLPRLLLLLLSLILHCYASSLFSGHTWACQMCFNLRGVVLALAFSSVHLLGMLFPLLPSWPTSAFLLILCWKAFSLTLSPFSFSQHTQSFLPDLFYFSITFISFLYTIELISYLLLSIWCPMGCAI